MFIKIIMITVGFLGFSTIALAGVDDCDDYLARHYKRDLKPVSLMYLNKTHMGDIAFPHQAAYVKVKNVGKVDMPAGSGFKYIKLRIGSKVVTGGLKKGLKSGKQTWIKVNLPKNSLKHCKKTTVHVDYSRNAGQWGCQVFHNDKKVLKAFLYKKHCLKIVKPIKPIIIR